MFLSWSQVCSIISNRIFKVPPLLDVCVQKFSTSFRTTLWIIKVCVANILLTIEKARCLSLPCVVGSPFAEENTIMVRAVNS